MFCLKSTRFSVLFAPPVTYISVSRLFVRRHQDNSINCLLITVSIIRTDLLGNEETGARQKIFGEVIDLRCGDRNPIARDGHVIGCGAAPELMNLISTSPDVTCTFLT